MSNNNSRMNAFATLRAHPELERVGLPWSEEEDAEIIRQAEAKIPLEDIAKAQKRTSGGIKSHLYCIAWKMHCDGMSFIQVCSKLNLDVDALHKFFDKKEGAKKPVKLIKPEIALLEEIRDLLKVLVEKMA